MGLCVDPDCDAIGHAPPARIGELMELSGGTVLGALRTMWDDATGRRLLLAKLILRRAWGLVSPYEAADNVDLDFLVHISSALRVAIPTGVLIPLGLAGAWLAFKRRRQCAVALGALGALGAALPVIPVLWRLRAGCIPVMLPLAGCSVAAWIALLRVSRGRSLAVLGVGLACVAVLYAFPPKPLFRLRHFESVSAARVHLLEGNLDAAIAELDDFMEAAQQGRVERAGIRLVEDLRTQLIRQRETGVCTPRAIEH